jgi:hypothetical protein
MSTDVFMFSSRKRVDIGCYQEDYGARVVPGLRDTRGVAWRRVAWRGVG